MASTMNTLTHTRTQISVNSIVLTEIDEIEWLLINMKEACIVRAKIRPLKKEEKL